MKLNAALSSKPCVSRKTQKKAKLQERRKLMRVALAKEEASKSNLSCATIRRGDTVKIVRGSHKNTEAVVKRVYFGQMKIKIFLPLEKFFF